MKEKRELIVELGKRKEKGFVGSLGGVTSSPVEREQSRTGKCGKSFDARAAIPLIT